VPLHLDIRINDRLLHQVHIGRVAGDTAPDSVNSYRAVVTAPGEEPDYWSPNSVDFTHRYGDGANACAREAFIALCAASQDIATRDTTTPNTQKGASSL
jgi:hypothetical protein